MGRAARERAMQLHWSAAVEGFSQVADEALARAGAAASIQPPVPGPAAPAAVIEPEPTAAPAEQP